MSTLMSADSLFHQVRYGESGWKERYYAHKLQVHKGDEPSL